MASTPMTLRYATLAASLAWVVIVELLMQWTAQHKLLPNMTLLGFGRVLQTGGVLWVVNHWEHGLGAIGWSPRDWPKGLWQGALWSIGFALAAGLGMLLIYLFGQNPLMLLRFPMPARPAEVMLLFLVGGLVGPVSEEICFRGILYTFFRRWGIAAALVASTAVFVVLHSTDGLPFTQVVGGLVFALAYETSRNLMVPITIHVLGNLALFALSLPIFR